MSDVRVLDDTDSELVYDPGAWQSFSGTGYDGRYNKTEHRATQANAKVSLAFTGRSISVTCYFSPAGANFTATLDGNLVGTYNTFFWDFSEAQTQAILIKDNLDANIQHQLVLEKAPNDPSWVPIFLHSNDNYIQIDSITLGNPTDPPSSSTPLSQSSSSSTSTSSSQSSSSTSSTTLSQLAPLSTSSSQSQSQSSSSTTSTPQPQSSSSPTVIGPGVIAGISVGIVAALALVVALIWCHRRLAQVARLSTSPSPFLEAGVHSDAKSPENTSTEPIYLPTTTQSSPMQGPAVALVAPSSSPARGEAEGITRNGIPQLGGRNDGGMSSFLNPGVSLILLPSVPVPSSSPSGGVTTSLLLQENAVLRDHLAALELTGGLGMLNRDDGQSDYHETLPEYEERDSDEED
ncbi:hypothetical protein M408DRAFT_23117 [Serendipita vermifera MAFF 305830]|uniref:Uncharacterized protein n=1 Tax=Serendipita vermifera MAFF 305830 TaxID=933852 RepID=A0A0C2WT80_SERVB|nr:hypothetical protein M408DRAFT_23117 [Serendipita vermifera MAFF 305830]